MKVSASVALATFVLGLSFSAQAADRKVYLPLQEAVAATLAEGKIDASVKFYLSGASPKGQILRRDVVSNRKTNAFGKSDAAACLRAAQSAIIAMHNSAKQAGANAVTNIVSYHRKAVYSSKIDYECHAGGVVAGVTLRGDFAKVKK